jgi:hypothetical protein
MKTLLTKLASPIRPCKRRSDQITDFDGADILAHRFDNPDKFVSHATSDLTGWHPFIRPEITAADGSAGDDHEGVGWLFDLGVRDILDTDIPSPIHNSCTHNDFLQFF